MKLVQFRNTANREQWVNADKVCSVEEYGNGTVEIHFGTEDGKVIVKEDISVVISKLAGAGKP